MKKIKKILLLLLLLMPGIVFASSNSTNNFTVSAAIGMELFVSLHMSVFVLKPLSEIITPNDSKKTFWVLFVIRALVLLFFDFFITTSIAILDFFAVFVGAFILIPILGFKGSRNGKSINSNTASAKGKINYLKKYEGPIDQIKCPNCKRTLKANAKFCPDCGVESVKAVSDIVNPNKQVVTDIGFGEMYKLSEDKLLEEFIKKELANAGIEPNNKQLPRQILKKKNILNIIFLVLVFIFISMIFFHVETRVHTFFLIILIIYFILTRRYNFIKYLSKEIKARPGEKISNIIMSTKENLTTNNCNLIFIVGFALVFLISFYIYKDPIIIYEAKDDGYAVRFYTIGINNNKTVTIPETHNGKPVISIRGDVFSNIPTLEEVRLPDTIIEIRGKAFKNDKNLKTINIPNKLEYLGGGAFYNCESIKNIVLPDTLTYMGGEVFYNASSLKSIKLSSNLTEIRGNSFENCYSLESIEIPDKVTRIGGHAFYGNTMLKNVIITKNSNLVSIGSSAFRKCSSLYNITLPKNVNINERSFKESPTSISYYGVGNNTNINNDNNINY